jgi:hypothetical protein
LLLNIAKLSNKKYHLLFSIAGKTKSNPDPFFLKVLK